MNLPKAFYIVIILLTINCSAAFAQSTPLSSGATISGSGGTVSYSVGQNVYSSYSTSAGSVTEGVQQTYDISTILENELEGISLSVYPNPATHRLFFELQDSENREMLLELVDLKGQVLKSISINQPQAEMNISDLASATYFLNASLEGAKYKTIKIIKNK